MNAQDKGGLIPLHNASSYGHLDIAALLLKYNTVVNATDKWGFTPLHEGKANEIEKKKNFSHELIQF